MLSPAAYLDAKTLFKTLAILWMKYWTPVDSYLYFMIDWQTPSGGWASGWIPGLKMPYCPTLGWAPSYCAS